MTLQIVTHADRPDLWARWNEAAERVWPTFMLQDAVCNQFFGGLTRFFPACQLYLLDEQTDELLGVGNTIPVTWDGTPEGLPGGVDDVLATYIGDREKQQQPTTLCAIQAAVLPGHQGTGLSRVIIGGMRTVAERLHFADLIAPVRPNMKVRYPLTPMYRYIQWLREDGLPLDAWLRVHARLGASIEQVAEGSMLVEGTVAEWEAWTELAFPESGEYVIPGALTTVTIDRTQDIGRYVEPNVWMRHRLI